MVSYASLAELKDRLCISDADRDFALDRCLDGASRWIEKETSRRFYTVSETRYFTAPRHSSWMPASDITERPGGGAMGMQIDDLVVPAGPVYPTLATDDDGDRVYETIWTYGTDFWLEPVNAAVDGKPYRRVERNCNTGRFFFPQFLNSVAITGTFGFSSTTPADIRELTLDVATLLAMPVLDMGLAGVKSYSITQTLRVDLRPQELSPVSLQIINNYRDAVVL
jgi:hypothetical protein